MSDSYIPPDSTSRETAIEIVSILLEALPYVGGVLSSTASYFLEKRKDQRLNRFLMQLAEDLQAVQDQINRGFAESEEFRDLTEDILSKAAETRQQEKLDALRAIFLNTIISNHPSYDEAAEIAHLLNSWQPRHVVLLKILDDPRAADEQVDRAVGEGKGISTSILQISRKLLPGWSDDQIERTWQDLYNQQIHRISGIRGMITDQGIQHLEGQLTNFGTKVTQYLRNPVHQ